MRKMNTEWCKVATGTKSIDSTNIVFNKQLHLEKNAKYLLEIDYPSQQYLFTNEFNFRSVTVDEYLYAGSVRCDEFDSNIMITNQGDHHEIILEDAPNSETNVSNLLLTATIYIKK